MRFLSKETTTLAIINTKSTDMDITKAFSSIIVMASAEQILNISE